MKKTLLMAVSAIALIATAPVFAETPSTSPVVEDRTVNQGDIPQLTKEETKKAWEETKDTVSDAAKDAKKAVSETYDDIKESLAKKSGSIERVSIDPRVTATGLIGKPVYNEAGTRIATVHDIILDKGGDADHLVLSDGKFSGLGNLIAVDYDDLTKQDGDVYLLAPLTASILEDAQTFTYSASGTTNTEVASLNGGVSVKELLGTDIVDTKGKTVAEVEDVSFKNGQADRLIVSFGQILGLGGDKAAMTFSDVAVKQDVKNNDVHVELSNNTLQEFKAYKQSLN